MLSGGDSNVKKYNTVGTINIGLITAAINPAK